MLRRGAFRVLHHYLLQDSPEYLVYSPSLRGRWLEHRLEEQRCGHHVLAGRAKEWEVISLGIFDDASIDVAGATSSCSPVSSGGLVLLQGLMQLP